MTLRVYGSTERVSASERAARAAAARSKSGSNRSCKKSEGHPCTSERIYSADEVEFMLAMEEFKKRTGKRFPTWSEALRVLRQLGYAKAPVVDLMFA